MYKHYTHENNTMVLNIQGLHIVLWCLWIIVFSWYTLIWAICSWLPHRYKMTHSEKRTHWLKEGAIGLGGLYVYFLLRTIQALWHCLTLFEVIKHHPVCLYITAFSQLFAEFKIKMQRLKRTKSCECAQLIVLLRAQQSSATWELNRPEASVQNWRRNKPDYRTEQNNIFIIIKFCQKAAIIKEQE